MNAFTLCSSLEDENMKDQKPDSWPFVLSIKGAAKEVGISRSQFYSKYINTGRIHLIPQGTRRLIDSDELYSAWQAYKAEARAVPTPEETTPQPRRKTSRGSRKG